MDSRFVGRAIYRTALGLRGETGVFERLEELRRLDGESAEFLRRRRDAALARILRRAGEVPFYRDHWESPPEVEVDRVGEQLAALPFLEKRHLQSEAARLHHPDPGRTTRKRTGGSTAEPVEVVKSASGLVVERAVSWLGYGWFGIEPGSRVARFWGTPLTGVGRLKFALADLAMRRIRFSAFELEPEDLDGYWRRCTRFRPEWLYGYTSILDLFAQHVEERGLPALELGLRAIVCTSEPLDRHQRDRLERVFGAPVQNEYGCGETGAIAYSCEEGLLHVMTESVHVELVGDDGNPPPEGELGEVVVTDLTNRAMPLVRYRLRDHARAGPERCPCGRPWPTLQGIAGRAYDAVFTPAGKRWHGEKMKYLMVDLHEKYGGFDQFQMVQTERDLLEVRLVTDTPVDPTLEEEIARYARERLDGMRTRVVTVDAVERAASGKLRVVRNDWGGGEGVPPGPA